MKGRIRFTGRKEIPIKSVRAHFGELDGVPGKAVVLSIINLQHFKDFSPDSRVRLRLSERKYSESLDFGELGGLLKGPVPVSFSNEKYFCAPSCHLRVVQGQGSRKGLILGSTKQWTLPVSMDSERDAAKKGLLLFFARNISPQTWKLEIRDDELPIVYLDRSIEQASVWASNNPVFVSCVLPVIVRMIFDRILDSKEKPDTGWMQDWLLWAEHLWPDAFGDERSSVFAEDDEQKREWIDSLVSKFCQDQDVLEQLLNSLKETEGDI